MEEEFSFEDDRVWGSASSTNPGPYDMLDSRAMGVLNFPNMLGFGPSRRDSGWRSRSTIRMMVLPPIPYPVVGFSYSSVPLTSETRSHALSPSATGQSAAVVGSKVNTAAAPATTAAQSRASRHNFFLAGEISCDGTAESLYIHKIGDSVSIKNMVVASFKPSAVPIWLGSLKYSGKSFTSRVTYTTDRHIILVNGLAAVSKNWSLGTEFLYSVVEAKPGLSLGLRYAKREGTSNDAATEFTISAGVMGHVRATYTREILPSIHLATRYEVNLNDLNSRMAGGVELRPSTTFPYLLKAKYDTAEGLGLAIGRKLASGRGAWALAFNYDRIGGPNVGLCVHF